MNEKERLDLLEKMGLSPERARSKLEHMGYTEEYWDHLIGGVMGSHEVRALIEIARGTEKRLLGEVYMEMRVRDGLPPERRPYSG